MRVIHMTSVHRCDDTRIFVKMCRSLHNSGHEVHLVATRSDGMGLECRDGVNIHGISAPQSRSERVLNVVPRILHKASELKGDIYHFHDPEFLLRAVKFQRLMQRPVVYDAHEDFRLDVLEKDYLPWGIRHLISNTGGRIETWAASHLKGVVAATPGIAERFQFHPQCTVVQNFPCLDEFSNPEERQFSDGGGLFVYAGGLFQNRGIWEMLEALEMVSGRARIALAGNWSNSAFRDLCRGHATYCRVEEKGCVDRESIQKLLNSAFVGLVALHPTRPYQNSYPVKMFEYMAAGIPVLASDFPLWRCIVEEANCGMLVDPLDPEAIAKGMQWFIEHPDEALEMGQSGRRAVEERYNWEKEFPKLQALYDSICH